MWRGRDASPRPASLRQFPPYRPGLRACRLSVHMPAHMRVRSLAPRLSARSLTTLLALAATASACQDAVTGPNSASNPSAPTTDAARTQAVSCSVDVRAGALSCGELRSTAGVIPGATRLGDGPRRTLVIGQQGVYVRLFGSAATPTSQGSDTLTVPVAVQNLLAQPLATTDGVTYDGRGVMVFFSDAPTVTGGTGTVTVVNADTTGTFTASGQKAFVYPQFLAGNQSTPEHGWQFLVPSSVTSFRFVVFVRAQLSNESSPLSAQPAHVFAANANAGIVGGGQTTCALRTGAGVYCWGTTAFGGVQDSTSTVPLLVPGSGDAVALGVSANSLHSCWLNAAGAASCVGDNSLGQLGDGSSNPAPTARAVQPLGGVTFTRLALGALHTCGLTAAGNAYCWGWDQAGQLGDGSSTSMSLMVAVHMPSGVHFAAIGAGSAHTCGLTSAGAAYCWGYNGSGQLGNGSSGNQDSLPHAVTMPVGVAFTQIAGGASFTCALTNSGGAYCWGSNASGQLGDNTQTDRLTPVRVQLPVGVTLTQLVTGSDHVCGRASDGTAYCWGDNSYGQLGENSGVTQTTPVAVLLPTGVTFAQLSAGEMHSCGLTAAGVAYCWGDNSHGQIGDGTGGPYVIRPTPIAVHMP